MNIIKRFTDKVQAFNVSRQAGIVRELAEGKSRSVVNTYVPAKERDRRVKRKKIAKASRRRNRG